MWDTGRRSWVRSMSARCSLCVGLAMTVAAVRAADVPGWLMATAQAVPKETTNQGSGYFSIVTGKNGRLYIGTAKYGIGSFLVEFDPADKKMTVVCDTHKAIGTTATGFAAQSKVHTRNNVGASGKIYFGTKQGYPDGRRNRGQAGCAKPLALIPLPAR
jgi:hypothetical protein